MIKSGADTGLIRGVAPRWNFKFSDFERFGLTSGDALDLFSARTIDFDNDLLQHIFIGEINSSGELVGYHYEGFSDAIATVDKSTVTALNQYGVYQAKVYAIGFSKKALSIFLKNWSPNEVEAPVLTAAGCSSKNILEYFLKKGAKVNYQNNKGNSPLMRAAYAGRIDNLKILLSYKADKQLKDSNGHTAMDLAKDKKQKEIVDYLEKQK